MIKTNTAAAKHAASLKLGPPVPALDLSGYTKVVIVKTTEIGATAEAGGHEYKRGSTFLVDATTLEALKAASAIAT